MPWKVIDIADHLDGPANDLGLRSYNWTASKGLIKWVLYEDATTTFHLFRSREERRKFARKLRGKKKQLKGVRRLRFKRPLLKIVDFFEWV